MTVYVIFDPNDNVVEICATYAAALAWICAEISEDFRVTRGDDTYIYTENGTFIISAWNVFDALK